MRVLKGGVIGCGFFSRHHVEAWRRLPNVRIVAACDSRIERAQAVSERAYVSAEAMLETEDLDFADIVSRTETHLDLVSFAAQRKLAISCQKPMAPDWATACRMVEAAEANGARLMIHDNWRWQPWYRAAQKMIAAGDIGSPVSYGFRCRWKDGAGEAPYAKQSYFRDLRRFIIDETLVHHIDTARFLFGDIQTVYAEAMRVNPRIQGEDHAILTLRHTEPVMGGCTATASPLLRMQARRLTKRFLKETPDRSASLARVRYGRGRRKSGPGIFRRGIAETASTTRRRTLFNAWKQASASRRKRASIWRRRSRRWRQRMRARPRTDA